MDGADTARIAGVARLAAQLMLAGGAETYRAEETARRICGAFGYSADVVAFPTGLMLSLGEEKSLIARVERRRVDFAVIDRVNAISRELAAGALPLPAAESELRELAGRPPMGALRLSAIAAGSSAMFALMFGGAPKDLAAAGAAAFLAQAALGRLRQGAAMPLVDLVGGFLTALAAHALGAALGLDAALVVISALMPMLPGLAMTNAIRDAMRGDLVSGVARAGEALIRAVVLAVGAGLAVSVWMALWGA
ncbi:MAG: threonine/serine exporter family protein [Clostridiales bacterium]|nr:threonine/serine exporter family protein [Clostridiales bacterium]